MLDQTRSLFSYSSRNYHNKCKIKEVIITHKVQVHSRRTDLIWEMKESFFQGTMIELRDSRREVMWDNLQSIAMWSKAALILLEQPESLRGKVTCSKSHYLLGDNSKSNSGLLSAGPGVVPPHYVCLEEWFSNILSERISCKISNKGNRSKHCRNINIVLISKYNF